jgi:NAD(P)-dependent dehydrogenase (short-subunit alcohol dehydrogenase family)
MSQNQKKIALVTGGNNGIGLETVRQLAKEGVVVYLGARDEKRGTDAAKTLRDEGLEVRFVPFDATSQASIDAAVKRVENDFGKLDILVANAGVAEWGLPASTESQEVWHRTFATNLFGVVATSQAFLPLLRKSEAGRIVHLTSILGSLALISDPKSPIGPTAGQGAAYAASKSALNMFTVQLAAELRGTNIKVNAAHPGWVKTELGGEGAPLDVVEGAKTSVALSLLGADGPTGKYIHLGAELPW